MTNQEQLIKLGTLIKKYDQLIKAHKLQNDARYKDYHVNLKTNVVPTLQQAFKKTKAKREQGGTTNPKLVKAQKIAQKVLELVDTSSNPIFMSQGQYEAIANYISLAGDAVYAGEASAETKDSWSYFKGLVSKIGIMSDDKTPAPTLDEEPVVSNTTTTTTTTMSDNMKALKEKATVVLAKIDTTTNPVFMTREQYNSLSAYYSELENVNLNNEATAEALKDWNYFQTFMGKVGIVSDTDPIVNNGGEEDDTTTTDTTTTNNTTTTDDWNDDSSDTTNDYVEPQNKDFKINHEVVEVLGDADDEVAITKGYSRIDRFVKNDEEKRFRFIEMDGSQLFVKGDDDKHSSGIDPYDIKQGGVGDCFLMASMSAVAKLDPNIIKNMIKDNKDGTFTVKLYRPIKEGKKSTVSDGSAIYTTETVGLEAVEVIVSNKVVVDTWPGPDSKHEANTPIYAKSQDQGELWPLIIEKAYAKLAGGYDNIDGGFSEEAFEVLTGRPRTSYDYGYQYNEAIKAFDEAIQRPNPIITFATSTEMSGDPLGPDDVDENGNPFAGTVGESMKRTLAEDGAELIVAGHAYTFDKMNGDKVQLINPHGKNHIKLIPKDNLFKYFSRITVDG